MADESGSNPSSGKVRLSTSPSPGAQSQSAQPRFILLVAEDNLPDALLVREVIRTERLPFDVHVASDGQKAIDFIIEAETDTDAPCPDFLLLDLNLPKKDGFEVLERLRSSEKFNSIPVVVMTSSNSPADRNRAAELGASYFCKPPNYEEFLKLGGLLKQLLHGKMS